MISEIIKNLRKGEKLLNSISNQQYASKETPPYFSSIGSHIRHILDVYQCVFKGLPSNFIDFTQRTRNLIQEESTEAGLEYISDIITQLEEINLQDLNHQVVVTDDLGNGKVEANYSLAAVLIQAHSHTIHHYAIIGFLVYNLGIELPDADFGYNPTTPKREILS